MVTKTWIVYGQENRSMPLASLSSFEWDFSNEADGTRIIAVDCKDKTGADYYVIVTITRDTLIDCINEFNGQLSDGLFENCSVGNIYSCD